MSLCEIVYEMPPRPKVDLSKLPEVPEIPDFKVEDFYEPQGPLTNEMVDLGGVRGVEVANGGDHVPVDHVQAQAGQAPASREGPLGDFEGLNALVGHDAHAPPSPACANDDAGVG